MAGARSKVSQGGRRIGFWPKGRYRLLIVLLWWSADWLFDGKYSCRFTLSANVLILHDLGLHRLTDQRFTDLYELIIGRHRVSSFIITSNRAVEEWLSLFDDAILDNSALDRLANASFQVVIEGASYREKLSPHRKLLGDNGGG